VDHRRRCRARLCGGGWWQRGKVARQEACSPAAKTPNPADRPRRCPSPIVQPHRRLRRGPASSHKRPSRQRTAQGYRSDTISQDPPGDRRLRYDRSLQRRRPRRTRPPAPARCAAVTPCRGQAARCVAARGRFEFGGCDSGQARPATVDARTAAGPSARTRCRPGRQRSRPPPRRFAVETTTRRKGRYHEVSRPDLHARWRTTDVTGGGGGNHDRVKAVRSGEHRRRT
jgi:hypothetical protein